MSTLFIIDQSLTKTGGHHFDYTRLIAQAAVQSGIDPVIATHRDLNQDAEDELCQFGEVVKVFRETTYTWVSHLAGLRELSAADRTGKRNLKRRPDPNKGRLHNFLALQARKKRVRLRSRLIRQFAEDCGNFFQRFSLDDSDHVFFTTISELEFMGLTAFLEDYPDSLSPTWHTQFHFSMFSGRPSEFENQHREERLLTGAFQSALARAPYHDIRAYTTSDELARQYNRMEVLSFEPLPYPVNPRFRAEDRRNSWDHPAEPLRVTVAGGVRREKGQKTRVNKLINAIWDTHIANGKVQIDLQTGKPGTFSSKRVLGRRRVPQRQFQKMVGVHSHPLPEDEYVDLIHNSNIGLFCYDSRRYYSRRAGILCEFLACGKPVIVPAGGWLSKQIADPVFEHIQSLSELAKELQVVDVTDMRWNACNVPLAGRSISFDQTRNPFQCEFRDSDLSLEKTDGISISFRWQWAGVDGSFVEVNLRCFDDQKQQIGFDKQIVTTHQNNNEALVFLRVPKGFSSAQLEFRNAYADTSINLADVSVRFLDFGNSRQPPKSAVGVIAADESMMADAVDELVNHYEHYQESAIRFSKRWSIHHDPLRTIEALMPISHALRRVA